MDDPSPFAMTMTCRCSAVKLGVLNGATPSYAGHCSCDDCTRATGGGIIACQMFVDKKMFRVLMGAEQLKGWSKPGGRTRQFCGTCGSSMMTDCGTSVMIYPGTFDNKSALSDPSSPFFLNPSGKVGAPHASDQVAPWLAASIKQHFQ
eukprot:scaffold12752_cov53-Attheya_sp.AAC.1